MTLNLSLEFEVSVLWVQIPLSLSSRQIIILDSSGKSVLSSPSLERIAMGPKVTKATRNIKVDHRILPPFSLHAYAEIV